MPESRYNKYPFVEVKGEHQCFTGWGSISGALLEKIRDIKKSKVILVIECYQGVILDEVEKELKAGLNPVKFISALRAFYPEKIIRDLVYRDVTDDRIFGYLTRLNMQDFLDPRKITGLHEEISSSPEGLTMIYGPGASLVCADPDILVYADMARWEIQLRMRRHEVDNLGVSNHNVEDWMLLYKQGFFVDWRVCDRLKKSLFDKIDFILDTNDRSLPKMTTGKTVLDGYAQAIKQPFSVVPFFDPGPWGGQWMKRVCGLDNAEPNYAWCFNCVPEENSLLLKIGAELFELPSVNLVFRYPEALLGSRVHARFGDEFPIRFDFLDTMDGGNLSLQVHPLTEYIQEKFGMHYTQDESYYMMDGKAGAVVYLGLKVGVDPGTCIADLEKAQQPGETFDAEKHIQTWPLKKHDHFLIPAGTIHCSGKNSMVLEISATPYIFTFKLWDWGRKGMDGKPRPINLGHGKNVIQWNRTTSWTAKNLVNRTEKVAEGDGWIEERTGLHEREFIETRRFTFTGKTSHDTAGGVNVVCLVEGDEVLVESPENDFEPFIVHYAEVFIVPAAVGKYTVRQQGHSGGKPCMLLKAYVRV